ncbi:hypothetical protein PENSPDRAFT_680157 [Peniophora sp. CONT]|nr:hypothetical protein PENSPDRAFT_680157 [Peniophora sp. CONT]
MATLSSAVSSATTSAFPCPTCGQELSRRGDLKRHMAQLHPTGNEQLWKCPHCPYQHVQKSNVKIHAEKHELKRTGERPHTCPEPDCTAAYQDKGLLTRHRKKKHGYQPNHSPRYLEKKGLPSGIDGTGTSRLSSDEGEILQHDQQMYEAPLTPPEGASTMGTVSPSTAHVRERHGAGTYSFPASFEPLQTAVANLRFDVACQSDSIIRTPRLPPITSLFQKADDCERKRPPPSFAPHFPGPLAPAPIMGHRRPASAQGHIGYHVPQPQPFQQLSDTLPPTVASPAMRERRPSSTPCLPTPPAFQTAFPSPPIAPQALPHNTPKVAKATRTPLSFVRQHRRPAPYPIAHGNNFSAPNAPRWHKWWMASGAAEPREAGAQFIARAHAVRSH